MREGFVPFSQLFAPDVACVEEPPCMQPEEEAPPPVRAEEAGAALDDVLREIRLFRARLIEALEASVATVLNDIAATVLARELELAPADVERIADRALQQYLAYDPVRVRVHPDDVFACSIPVVPDEQLRRGDVLVELRGGFIDATLGARLECVAPSLR